MRGPDPTLAPPGVRPTRDDPDGCKRRLDDAVEDRYLVKAARAILTGSEALSNADKVVILNRNGNFTLIEAWIAIDIIDEENKRPYGPMCRDPAACKGKGYCSLDPTCGD